MIFILFLCSLIVTISARPQESNSYIKTSNNNVLVDTTSKNCSYYANKDYKCVPYYGCEDGEIVTDGSDIINIRSLLSAELDPASSKCPGYLEVCCRHPKLSTNAPPPASTPRTPRSYVPQCGKRNYGGIGVRIQYEQYKGSTQFGEWPHMCAVLEHQETPYDQSINVYQCGGSLIAPGVILTAAHCVQNLKSLNIKVRCGEWDTQQEVEPRKHQDRFIEDVMIHPLYDPKNLHNDFALLFTEKDFELSTHIDTICLPDNLDGIYSYEQEDCIATGWGKDRFGNHGEYQVILKQVEMNMVNSTECEKRLRRTRLGKSFKLDESFVCAGGEKNKDTCKGDGGSPLVCLIKSNDYSTDEPRYVQAGIVAWGINCGVEGNPGVYANVADGLCFIHWATRCKTELQNYFQISGCENWVHDETQALRYQNERFQRKLDVISRDESETASSKKNILKKIAKNELFLNKFEKANHVCQISRTEPPIDLSNFARTKFVSDDDSQSYRK
ncbi:phenoloxidase-activating factor 2 [Lepeophtheirus salmonis]|uniref:phenoloxidase-activating factor 2 n=1 Tax=Lepeophtheirus salmonis TaxID=72036 RepID=UPI001AE101E8|nr:phenoloxidase-activating factor 2-like [Lepeophtheirus salmonis]